jgi:hemerythrin-like domain-containing protein
MTDNAANTAIRLIRQEHSYLATILNAMRYFVKQIAEGGKAPDLKVFRAMAFYISEYPERMHHPKEDRYLFALLRKRTTEADNTLATLETQHGQGERMARELEHALTRYELFGQSAFAVFAEKVERYAALYVEHMALEEDIVLPAAKKALLPEDWEVIAVQFASNRDPLSEADSGADFDKLFTLITTITPAPLGVGPAL